MCYIFATLKCTDKAKKPMTTKSTMSAKAKKIMTNHKYMSEKAKKFMTVFCYDSIS